MCSLLPADEPKQRRTRKARFLQEQVGSAWYSSTSGRVGWGAPWLRIAQGCSKAKEPFPFDEGKRFSLSFWERTGVRSMKRCDLARLSKPGERHDSRR